MAVKEQEWKKNKYWNRKYGLCINKCWMMNWSPKRENGYMEKKTA